MATDDLDVADPAPEAERDNPLDDLPRRPWYRRVLRRAAKTVAVVFVALTMLSVPYNAYTAGTVAPPPGLTYVTVAGIHTRYETWGTGGSPIVLVHGAFEDSDSWQDLAALLAAQHHRVYALDLTGSGYSQRVSPYTPQHMAAQLTGLVAALDIGRPVLVAHSSGAAVAAEAVLESPRTYSGLMFLDGDGLPIPSPPTWILGPLRTSVLRLVLRSDWAIRTIYASECGPACPRLDAAGVERFRRPYQVAGAEQGLWDTIDTVGGPGLPASRLAQVKQLCLPKAVTFGAQDSMFADDAPESVAANIGAPAPTIIQGAHHLSLVSHPAQVAASVEALVARAGSGC